MLCFICSLFLNEKNSNISIRKRHYSFTAKISRYCKEAEQPPIDKKIEKKKRLEKCLRRCLKSWRHFENNVEKRQEKSLGC